MRRYLLGGALALAAVAPASAHHSPPTTISVIERIHPDLAARRAAGAKPWAWLRRASASRWERTHPAARRRHARLEAAARWRSEADPLREEFLCIARHESGMRWNVSTGNGYYGGLQMDRDFQRTYGPRLYATIGTADRWTPDQQIAVASRAVSRRGFHPWPNTARMCGLL